MKAKNKLRKLELRNLILVISLLTGVLIFFNRLPNFLTFLTSQALKDQVLYDFIFRKFIEHVTYGFFFTLLFFFFIFGVQKFFNKDADWKFPLYFGIGTTLVATAWWEIFNRVGGVDYLDILYDLMGVSLSYLYIKYFGDFK